jgi:hypothetical protein
MTRSIIHEGTSPDGGEVVGTGCVVTGLTVVVVIAEAAVVVDVTFEGVTVVAVSIALVVGTAASADVAALGSVGAGRFPMAAPPPQATIAKAITKSFRIAISPGKVRASAQ